MQEEIEHKTVNLAISTHKTVCPHPAAWDAVSATAVR